MIEIVIPGFCHLRLQHLVLDYNGTLARDGKLLPRVAGLLRLSAKKVQIHIVTADTFGLAAKQLSGLPAELKILPPASQAEAKLALIAKLGRQSVVAIGNGRNDRKMVKAAALGIAVVQGESAATQTIMAADICAPNIHAALELLLKPDRLKATLRS